ncbi:Biopolymer transport protein exbB [Raoultella terrigena]|uniref:Biopolymer transport protein exbB n=1 Tax=Raoultella terrigena TaxID=577 RepID=A0A3P8KSP5_RAOTE|nr:Biopolymer transport protein exbB [Raoultella terrigena]
MGNNLMQADLSVWGMYHHADIVVKVVMIGLILASIVTWAIFFGKGAEILSSKRRLKREQQLLGEARSLDQASDIANAFHPKSLSTQLLNEAQNELELSAGVEDNEGIKERTGFRLERRVALWVVIWAAETATWRPSAPSPRSSACLVPSGAS